MTQKSENERVEDTEGDVVEEDKEKDEEKEEYIEI